MNKLLVTLFLSCLIFCLNKDLTDKEIKKSFLDSIKEYTTQKRETKTCDYLVSDIMSYVRVYSSNANDLSTINRMFPKATKIKNFLSDVYRKKINTINKETEYVVIDFKKSYEYFCSAIFNVNKLYYYCFEVTNEAYPLIMYQWKTIRKCQGWWLWERCGEAQVEEQRNLTANEMKLISEAVKSKSFDSFKSRYYSEYDDFVQENKPYADPDAGSSTQDKKTVDNQRIVMATNLKRIIDSYKRTKPNNYHPLVRNIKVESDVRLDQFKKNSLRDYFLRHKLPDSVMNDIKASIIDKKVAMKDVKYQSFDGTKTVKADDLVGYATVDGDNVFFSYIRTITSGKIPNRTKVGTKQECVWFIWFKWCYDLPKTEPNPLSANEMNIVKDALFYINLETIQKKLKTIRESQTLLGSQGKIISPNQVFIAYITKEGIVEVKNQRTGQIVLSKGNLSSTLNQPYNLQITDKGNIFIINKNNDKVWTTNTAKIGKAPYRLELDNNGKLLFKDANGAVLYE